MLDLLSSRALFHLSASFALNATTQHLQATVRSAATPNAR